MISQYAGIIIAPMIKMASKGLQFQSIMLRQTKVGNRFPSDCVVALDDKNLEKHVFFVFLSTFCRPDRSEIGRPP